MMDSAIQFDLGLMRDGGLEKIEDAARDAEVGEDIQRLDSGTVQDATTNSDGDVDGSLDAGMTSSSDGGETDLDAGFIEDAGQLPPDTGTHTSTCVPQPTRVGAPAAYGDATRCLDTPPVHQGTSLYFTTGQAWGDFDGDDWLDLYVTNQQGPNILYRNLQDGRFERVRTSTNIELPLAISGGASFADFDNDGDPDLYVLNHGPNVLFRNDPGGFVDITATASVGDPGKGMTASWADYNQDGYLDLFVSNWLCDDCVSPPDPVGSRDRLYRNNGNGTFTDVTDLLGYEVTLGSTFSAIWLDIDNDNDLDLYTANDHGILGTHLYRNVLWRNDGPGCGGWCFTETASAAGAAISLDGMGLAAADYDNDGDLDVFCTNRGPPVLLENDGRGNFTEVGMAAGVADDSQSWGAMFYDYNNDSRLDLYVAIGWDNWGIDDNRLYENLGNGQFQDVNRARRIVQAGITFGVAYADYDKDGFLDLVTGNLNTGYRLYRQLAQAGAGENWVRYRLSGSGPINRDGVGARVYIELDNGETLMQEVKSGSSLGSGNDLALHFGLGQASIQQVTIRWPNGIMQRPGVPSPNQEIRVQYQ